MKRLALALKLVAWCAAPASAGFYGPPFTSTGVVTAVAGQAIAPSTLTATTAYLGAGATTSSFTALGALNLASNSALTASGANGNLVSASSITTTGGLFGGALTVTGPTSLSTATFGVLGASTTINGPVVISTGYQIGGVAVTAQGGVALEVVGVDSASYLVSGGGAVGSPGFRFGGQPTTGFYPTGTNNWAWSGAGTLRWTFASGGGITGSGTGAAAMGTGITAAGPAFAYSGDSGTGMYRPTAGVQVWSSSATAFMVLQSSGGTNPIQGNLTLLPGATVTLQTGNAYSPSSYIFGISSATNVAASVFGVTQGGHVVSSGTTPGIACSAGAPVMLVGSNDQSGSFTAGAAATNCTVTFVTAWSKTPICMAVTNAATPVALSSTPGTSTVVFTALGALTGDTLYYFCWGPP